MQQLKRRLTLMFASSFGTAALVVAPVWAAQGTNAHSTSDKTAVVTTASETTTTTTDDQSNLHSKAQELLQQKRANSKPKSQEARQKACTIHEDEINKRVDNYAKAAQRHLDVFDKLFTKVQDFYKAKSLNVANYDSLVATATAKQTAAQGAVDTLKALDVDIDCTQPDPAMSVATVKTAVATTRTALQDYRKSIKDVVVALKGASTSTDKASSDTNSTDKSSTGGDQ